MLLLWRLVFVIVTLSFVIVPNDACQEKLVGDRPKTLSGHAQLQGGQLDAPSTLCADCPDVSCCYVTVCTVLRK